MAKPVTFNVQRLIAAVATEHRLLFKPDDAAFAIVTMNRLVLEESREKLSARLFLGIWRNSSKPRSGLTAALSRLSEVRRPRLRCGRNSRAISILRAFEQRRSSRRSRRLLRNR